MSAADHLYPVEIAGAAARLEQAAVAVRQRAAVLASGSDGCPWDGAGARAFRTSAAATVIGLRRAATGLDETAAALRRHGAAVENALAVRDAAQARHDLFGLPVHR